MARVFTGPGTLIDAVVRAVILPVAAIIPFLVRTGLLFILFALLWVALVGSMVLQPAALTAAWTFLGGLSLPVQALAWLLFLPVTAGLWAWNTDWPLVVRVLLVLGLAGWNLLVFLPRRGRDSAALDPTPSTPVVS